MGYNVCMCVGGGGNRGERKCLVIYIFFSKIVISGCQCTIFSIVNGFLNIAGDYLFYFPLEKKRG